MAWPTKLQRMMEGKDTVSGVAPTATTPPTMHVPAPHLPNMNAAQPLLPHMPNENTFPTHMKPQPRFSKLFTKK